MPRLTLIRAKEALARFAPADDLEYRIARVVERYLSSGKFLGSQQKIAIVCKYGQLTLPRHYRTVEGVRIGGVTYSLGNEWFQTLPGSDCSGFSCGLVRDLGDGWAIMYSPRVNADISLDPTMPANDIPAGGTITVDYAGADTLTVDIYGSDSEGLPVLLHFAGKQTLANPFARISRIHKEIGNVSVRVNFTTTDAIVTTLALMEPTEEETCYRRYMVDSLAATPSAAVAALCLRRFIEFASDQDVLPISNIPALEAGMNSYNFSKENDVTLANQYFSQGLQILNEELRGSKSSTAVPPFILRRFDGPGSGLTSRY